MVIQYVWYRLEVTEVEYCVHRPYTGCLLFQQIRCKRDYDFSIEWMLLNCQYSDFLSIGSISSQTDFSRLVLVDRWETRAFL